MTKKEINKSIETVNKLRTNGNRVLDQTIKEKFIILHCKDSNGYNFNYYILREKIEMKKSSVDNTDDEMYSMIVQSNKYNLISEIFKNEGYYVDGFDEDIIFIQMDKYEYEIKKEFIDNFNKLYRNIKYNYVK